MPSLADLRELNGKTTLALCILSMCVSIGVYIQNSRTIAARVDIHDQNFAKMPPPEKVANTDVVNAQYESLKQEMRDVQKDVEDVNAYLREHK